ncbi:hypothetical protein [Streptomyces sp. CB01881]|uniref:hypothetical protein n=1 Tax=Streptomyces sp. CB01881 TaxID=2078691 RepID=UPI000CDC4056|nr:hypothetical protein [Streptomyces sp. CB01881]AUY48316.1 hypothetical protein C2142_04325 [Streptomyces sp. CB01881]TYC76803.1 hypothetical protein EH183_04335 [Streptomyces sp. CB01881]
MPKNHARKSALAAIKSTYKLTHTDAIALLDHPDTAERVLLYDIFEGYKNITTYKAAVELLEQQRNARDSATTDEHDDDLVAFDFGCEGCGYLIEGFHCCDCGADHEYSCVC